LDELLKLTDRIVVVSEGKFVYESETKDADFSDLGKRMAGH
jgi:simple sugar transport system ATP-binding protein